jgi:transposase-like protein
LRRRSGLRSELVVPDASAHTLIPWCALNIKVGSLVITDGWPAYNGLEKFGYAHRRILQSSKGKKTGAYLPMVQLIVRN